MNQYQLARERINTFIKDTGSLKNDLDLLAFERAKINFKLIDAWLDTNNKLVSDFDSYIDLRDTERKLGEAFKKYWHTVLFYRSFYFLTDNIKFSKIISLEYYFCNRMGVLQRTGVNPSLSIDSQNVSQSLFYKNPLLHFFGFKILSEILSRTSSPMTPAGLQSLALFPSIIFDSLHRFENNHGDDLRDYFDLKNHLDKDRFLSKVLELIDSKS
ncbi:hypothetical protein LFX25_20380 [Leptospira sp. FAT2]|uniref:hypothetical protein n=1 Tax=Leptospira sanjuanensis TaxID=2879643 RepID=UPI001EE85371|nr:hypothetical protein [Leptospira sanjuanensis]MCG6195603.1 hypothetical protein [Leptospira sanjuanensis]